MFGKKKKEPVLNWADARMNELRLERHEAFQALQIKARKAYICAEALKVYKLSEPDGEQAQEDLNSAKYNLKCAIGRYDSVISEIEQHCAAHHDEMEKQWNTDYISSHRAIEWTIEEIISGR